MYISIIYQEREMTFLSNPYTSSRVCGTTTQQDVTVGTPTQSL